MSDPKTFTLAELIGIAQSTHDPLQVERCIKLAYQIGRTEQQLEVLTRATQRIAHLQSSIDSIQGV